MSNLLLSIVTITKADADGLNACLTSTALWRASSIVEQIVVDGDGDARQKAETSGCRWIRQSGTGISAAFNEGTKAASGEWIWFLNGGDAAHELLKPEWLLTMLGTTGAQVVTGSIHLNGELTPRPLPHFSYQWPLIACWLAHPATLVRRDLLIRSGGFDERRRIAMDYDLWFRLLNRSVTVDAVSVPFARFDTKGISERASSRSAARREEAIVVAKNIVQLLWSGVWLFLRLLRRILWAIMRILR